MRIVSADVMTLTIPFTDGGKGVGLTPDTWNRFETTYLRLTTDSGLVGWGEAFSYACRDAVAAALKQMVVPLLLDQELTDPEAMTQAIQRKLHLFGRYGITIFAISAADTALWDLKAKSEGVSVSALFGEGLRREVTAYASLVRYGDAETVERFAAKARREGYDAVKLHEIEEAPIVAGRRGAGPDAHLTVDVNCAWDLQHACTMSGLLQNLGVAWLEEPLFPPEDIEAMAALKANCAVPLAAGENACTRYEFARMIRSGAITYPQPSVTKVGGISEARRVLALARDAALTCMFHSPYFGPGYFATLQLLANAPGEPLFEYLYVEPDAFPGRRTPLPRNGVVMIPETVGLGFEPDQDVFARYASNA